MFEDLFISSNDREEITQADEDSYEEEVWDTNNVWSTEQIPGYVWTVD